MFIPMPSFKGKGGKGFNSSIQKFTSLLIQNEQLRAAATK